MDVDETHCGWPHCRGCPQCHEEPFQACPGCGEDTWEIMAGECQDCGPIECCVECETWRPREALSVVDDDYHCAECVEVM